MRKAQRGRRLERAGNARLCRISDIDNHRQFVVMAIHENRLALGRRSIFHVVHHGGLVTDGCGADRLTACWTGRIDIDHRDKILVLLILIADQQEEMRRCTGQCDSAIARALTARAERKGSKAEGCKPEAFHGFTL